MNTLSISRHILRIGNLALPSKYLRATIPLLLLSVYYFDVSTRPLILEALSDAYITVGVFVAMTLYAYYVAERKFGFDFDALEGKNPAFQIMIAAVLGALPGCGGAIIVVSQYAAGRLGFAALVTVLISTMGDAAFLLIAKKPIIGIAMMAIGLVVGVISGLIINAIHPSDFLKRPQVATTQNPCRELPNYSRKSAKLWLGIFIIAIPITLLSAFQLDFFSFDIAGNSIDIGLVIGIFGAALCVIMWAILPLKSPYRGIVAEDQVAMNTADKKPIKQNTTVLSQVIHDTNFIMIWVILAFVLFELLVHYTGLDIARLFNSAAWLAPAIGLIVGFLPGCGPQIIIATLYLQGIAPISTLVANAISNDGDALFPAIALAPKAALIATVYSAIPAALVGYAIYYFL